MQFRGSTLLDPEKCAGVGTTWAADARVGLPANVMSYWITTLILPEIEILCRLPNERRFAVGSVLPAHRRTASRGSTSDVGTVGIETFGPG